MKKIGFIAYVSVAVILSVLFTYVGLQSRGFDPNKEDEDNPVNKDYQDLQAPIIEELANRSWDNPPPQRDDDEGNWVYEVFTPPKIYVEEVDGVEVFTAKLPNVGPPPPPPVIENPEPSFGVSLTSVYRPPFRVLLRGVLGNPQDPSKTLVYLEYLDIPEPKAGMMEASILSKKTLQGVIGKYWEAEKIRIISHTTVDVVKNGLPSKTDKVTIGDYTAIDPATNKIMTVDIKTGTTPVPGPNVYLTLSPSGNPSLAPVFLMNPQVGHKFNFVLKDSKGRDYEAHFTLTEFAESPPSVTLQKVYKWIKIDDDAPIEAEKTEKLMLTRSALPAPGTSSTSPNSAPTTPPPPIPGGALPIPGSTSPGTAAPGVLPSPSTTFPFPAASSSN